MHEPLTQTCPTCGKVGMLQYYHGKTLFVHAVTVTSKTIEITAACEQPG